MGMLYCALLYYVDSMVEITCLKSHSEEVCVDSCALPKEFLKMESPAKRGLML